MPNQSTGKYHKEPEKIQKKKSKFPDVKRGLLFKITKCPSLNHKIERKL